MIFSPELADKIVHGTKTVTRRPANGKPCPHRVGSVQKLQPGQGQVALPGRIQIKSVRLERLRDVTIADAKREGFGGSRPLVQFFSVWAELYGLDAPDDPVYRIEFEYLAAS